jgi:Arc/MetJ family transcription regulator
MKTTLDLPEDLLAEAMQKTQLETETKVIIRALEELVRKETISELKKFKGKIDLDVDINSLRGRECRF